MPHMTKGGKFVFGKSLIRQDGTVQLPTQAVEEYNITADNPNLQNYASGCGEFIKYKGRFYCWLDISETGIIHLRKETMDFLDIKPGMYLLAIRSSNIAFTMSAKGPLIEKAHNYEGVIPEF